jgi:hypothetical protein
MSLFFEPEMLRGYAVPRRGISCWPYISWTREVM